MAPPPPTTKPVEPTFAARRRPGLAAAELGTGAHVPVEVLRVLVLAQVGEHAGRGAPLPTTTRGSRVPATLTAIDRRMTTGARPSRDDGPLVALAVPF